MFVHAPREHPAPYPCFREAYGADLAQHRNEQACEVPCSQSSSGAVLGWDAVDLIRGRPCSGHERARGAHLPDMEAPR